MNSASTFENPFVKDSELTLSPEDLEAINKGEVVEINGEKGTEDEDSVYTVIDFKTFVNLIIRSLDFKSTDDVLCFPWFYALHNHKNWTELAATNFVEKVLPDLDYCDAKNLANSLFDVYEVVEDCLEGGAFESFFGDYVFQNIREVFNGHGFFDIIVYNGEASELGLKLD